MCGAWVQARVGAPRKSRSASRASAARSAGRRASGAEAGGICEASPPPLRLARRFHLCPPLCHHQEEAPQEQGSRRCSRGARERGTCMRPRSQCHATGGSARSPFQEERRHRRSRQKEYRTRTALGTKKPGAQRAHKRKREGRWKSLLRRPKQKKKKSRLHLHRRPRSRRRTKTKTLSLSFSSCRRPLSRLLRWRRRWPRKRERQGSVGSLQLHLHLRRRRRKRRWRRQPQRRRRRRWWCWRRRAYRAVR
jgi:hypothetical protein